MRLYEGMFLVDNSEARKNYDGVNQNIARIITKYGGEILRSQRWSERRLAYPVRRRDRGTYVLVYFNASPESITEIRRDCAIDEVILRNMILRAGALPEKEPETEAAAEPVQKEEATETAMPAETVEPTDRQTDLETGESVKAVSEDETTEDAGEPQETVENEPAGESAAVEKESAADAPAE